MSFFVNKPTQNKNIDVTSIFCFRRLIISFVTFCRNFSGADGKNSIMFFFAKKLPSPGNKTSKKSQITPRRYAF
jgi:hypothetical protein